MALSRDCLLFMSVLLASPGRPSAQRTPTETTPLVTGVPTHLITRVPTPLVTRVPTPLVTRVPTPLVTGSPTTPDAPSSLVNETLREIQEVIDDSGRIAGIVIGVLGGMAFVLAVMGFCFYRQYLQRNITSMNFDNPVYRKTTEDQFSLEKNQYQPARSYPSSLEPLTSPGTNEFV